MAARALVSLDAGERHLLSAYTQGVNAFMESLRDRLPIEFQLLRYQPQPWRDLDCLVVSLPLSAALGQSWQTDLMRERITRKLGKDLAADVFPDHLALDEAVAEVEASAKAGPRAATATCCPAVAAATLRIPAHIPPNPIMEGMGSNNWVVSGFHTKSGKPLLANDPHLGYSIPSIWYMIHLKAPGLDVSLPGWPFVAIGHNEHIAWGITNIGTDVQDLYIESFNFQDSNKYLYNGAWVNAMVRDEFVKVRNEKDDHVTVKVTRHGPVISHDGDRALALRWTLLEPHAVRIPFGRINHASNWQEFTAALHVCILNPKLDDDSSAYHRAMSAVFLQNVVEQNLTRWLPPGDADFNVTLIKSLEEGIRQIPGMVHSQRREAWKWGDTIPLTFHHPLTRGAPLLGRWLDVGPFPQAGTGTTVKQTTPSVGPSMRMVVDFSDFDQSVQNITLGESGQPFSPYYKDQFDAWYTG